MALGTQMLLTTSTLTPQPAAAPASAPALAISVLFTSPAPTVAALRRAGELASHLNARITLIVPQAVPYPLPLASPPVLVEFNERRFRVIAEESHVETTVQIYLCRDPYAALEAVLADRSVVIVGLRRRWWPSREKRLVKRLRRAGHDVMITETE